MLDRLDEAFEIANQALRQARFTGDRQDFVLCRVRRAQVMQFQGKLEEAASELTQCVLESETHEWNLTAAFARETRGKVHFEQDDPTAPWPTSPRRCSCATGQGPRPTSWRAP